MLQECTELDYTYHVPTYPHKKHTHLPLVYVSLVPR